MLTLNASATLRISSFFGTSVSIQYDTCIPMMYGLNFGRRSTEASFPVNFERFTDRRFPFIPGIVKLRESPGRAGGLPRINYQTGTIMNNGGGTSATVSYAYANANVSYTSITPTHTSTTFSDGIEDIYRSGGIRIFPDPGRTGASASGETSTYRIWFYLQNPTTVSIYVPYRLYAESNSFGNEDDTNASLFVRLGGPGFVGIRRL